MNIITQNKRYCPHEITTKIKSVELYRKTKDISFVCRRYHISKSSLMRWNKRYDGTRESLAEKSHRPKTPHPNAHTEQELKWIKDYHRRNPNISICELYGKLRENKAYRRHPGSLYRVFVRLGFRKKVESTKKK
jgi:transposase